MPYTEVLAFDPSAKAKAKSGPTPTKTFLRANDVEMSDVPAELTPAPGTLTPLIGEEQPTAQQREINAEPVENPDNTWVTPWMNEVSDITTSRGEVIWEATASKAANKCKGPPSLILDSGSSRTVVGRGWVTQWYELCDYHPIIKLTPSSRKFRIGSWEVFASSGTATLRGLATQQIKGIGTTAAPLSIMADLLDSDLPLLVSKETLLGWKALMAFGSTEIQMYQTMTIPTVSKKKRSLSLSVHTESESISRTMRNRGSGFGSRFMDVGQNC